MNNHRLPIPLISANTLFRFLLCLVLFCLVLFPGISHAQNYLGATAALQKVEEQSSMAAPAPPKSAIDKLRDDFKSFSETCSNLPPAEAAKQWLALIDRIADAHKQAMADHSSDVTISPGDFLGALPPPKDWEELANAINARPPAKSKQTMSEAGFRLLAATLLNDPAAQNREITNLQAIARSANNPYLLQQVCQVIAETSHDPDAILQSLGSQINTGQGVHPLEIPNLVSLVGPEKTKSFLQQALISPYVSLYFQEPNATSRLAQKLALQLMDQMKIPQWGLIDSLDAVGLYEAMDKKFGTPTNTLPSVSGFNGFNAAQEPFELFGFQKTARLDYLLGLISQDRTTEAVAFAKKFNDQSIDTSGEILEAMESAGYAPAVDKFLHDLLAQDPSLPFWDAYVQVSAIASQTSRMVALVQTSITNTNLSEDQQRKLHVILFKAFLANDDIDNAMQEVRHLATTNSATTFDDEYGAGQLGATMAQIGILLSKPNLTQEGISIANTYLSTTIGPNHLSETPPVSIVQLMAQILFNLNRGPEAEALLIDAIAHADQVSASQNLAAYGYDEGDSAASQLLSTLATLYFKAGRNDDVLTLLQKSPDWGVKDLADLTDTTTWYLPVAGVWSHDNSSVVPMLYLAARSLIAKGKNETAQKITDALIARHPDWDCGYELLLALKGTNAYAELDELFLRDQFEKRPLIWKAHLLRQQNRLAEAEKVIRQAIAIDPSDGEANRGDRMRAYAELADILEALGNAKDADFYRQIVKAIRMSEDADQLHEIGLLNRAIPLYEQALDHFSDAYCIQSRLAIQLADLGRNAEAEEHYRRAYELMPDSFGRVESHCFGCERAFDGEKAQSIAEKVFTQLAVERPDKPQVHYLLGYLHVEQEKYREAFTNYQAAVRLDPDYLNAWINLQGTASQLMLSATERNEIAFNILRLDPLGRHSSVDFLCVTDLPRLWAVVASATAHQPPAISNLLTLDASKLALDKKPKSYVAIDPGNGLPTTPSAFPKNSPQAAVAQTAFVQIAGMMISSLNASE